MLCWIKLSAVLFILQKSQISGYSRYIMSYCWIILSSECFVTISKKLEKDTSFLFNLLYVSSPHVCIYIYVSVTVQSIYCKYYLRLYCNCIFPFCNLKYQVLMQCYFVSGQCFSERKFSDVPYLLWCVLWTMCSLDDASFVRQVPGQCIPILWDDLTWWWDRMGSSVEGWQVPRCGPHLGHIG
jgi:hypothetical protein